MKIDIRNHSAMTGIEEVAEQLYKFAHKQLSFNKPARIVFESQGDRAVDIFSPTGHYKPDTHTVTIYVDHRHPKDILRSMAHELIHHAQCCDGQFEQGVDTSPGYAQKDQHMREMEKDAYFRGNITLFRDWEDNYKKGRNLMNENKEKVEVVPKDTIMEMPTFDTGGHGDVVGGQTVEDKKANCPEGMWKEEPGGFGFCDDKGSPVSEEQEEIPLKEWYNNQLHEALLRKFKIKK
tara:strand:- start:233 stop:937 length:705 start_codon:yes stop_codon:yes gene_type:complete